MPRIQPGRQANTSKKKEQSNGKSLQIIFSQAEVTSDYFFLLRASPGNYIGQVSGQPNIQGGFLEPERVRMPG